MLRYGQGASGISGMQGYDHPAEPAIIDPPEVKSTSKLLARSRCNSYEDCKLACFDNSGEKAETGDLPLRANL